MNLEEFSILFKNPDENEQRKYNYHNIPLSSANNKEIEQYCIQEYFQQLNEQEWRQEYIPKVYDALKSLSPKQYNVIELYIFRNME